VDKSADLRAGIQVRNEFAAVTLTVRSYGRGTRLEIRSSLFGTAALIDATILEALSRMDQSNLAELVGLSMTRWDERHEGGT
jgi:hypothetical protein